MSDQIQTFSAEAEEVACLRQAPVRRADGRTARFEAIILPLVHPASEVTRYLGALSAFDAPAWLGTEPVVATALASSEIVWPEGRPYTFDADDARQLPFAPELAAARVFRAARRQFRILDGGRKG